MKPWAPVLAVVAVSLFMPRTVVAQTPPIAAFSPCAWGSADCNACVADPVWSVQRLRSHGDAMGFHMNGTPDVDLLHHWQGVQRLMAAGGRYVAISRSLEDESTDVSFVVVEMASRDTRRAAISVKPARPIVAHRLDGSTACATGSCARCRTRRDSCTPAACSRLVTCLAVPFEKGPGSKVVFYDLTDPEHPVRLANEVDHTPLSDEAGTATLAKLANGHFLLVIGRSDADVLDFYVSTGTDLRTTDYTWFDTWHEDELTGDDSKFGNYQNLSFVAGCGGTLFMVGTHRSSVAGFGNDFIDLFTVTNGLGDDVAIHKVAKKQLTCSGQL